MGLTQGRSVLWSRIDRDATDAPEQTGNSFAQSFPSVPDSILCFSIQNEPHTRPTLPLSPREFLPAQRVGVFAPTAPWNPARFETIVRPPFHDDPGWVNRLAGVCDSAAYN